MRIRIRVNVLKPPIVIQIASSIMPKMPMAFFDVEVLKPDKRISGEGGILAVIIDSRPVPILLPPKDALSYQITAARRRREATRAESAIIKRDDGQP